MISSPLPVVITLLNVLLLFVTTAAVGRARARYQIKAPATTGHVDFERIFRVQMNTLEATVSFLPCLWIAAIYWNPYWASYLGLLWLFARVWYAVGYRLAANKRGIGFILGMIANIILFFGCIWGVFN
jgi:glutathione S-transferase